MERKEHTEAIPGRMQRSRSRYEDIIGLSYPPKGRDMVKHPPMPRADRAKIFAPFAALKGYEEAIAAKIAERED